MSETSPATDAPAEREKSGAGAESGAADAATREARGTLASPTEAGRKPIAAGGGEGPAEKRTPIAAGGSYTPSDGAQPATAHDATPRDGREGGEQAVVHPADGVGYAFDSSKTDAKVLGERLSSFPDKVRDALKQGGENIKVEITAGASSIGSTSYNQKLSEARGQDMANAMRDMGVKADINIKAIGESQAVKAGAPKGVDNPADRVATIKVEVEQRAPQTGPAGDTKPAVGDGQKTAEGEGAPAAEKKFERGVEITLQAKGGVADPTRDSKVSVSGKAPVEKEEFDATASVSGKAGDLSGEAKAGAWGKGEAGFKAGDKGVGVYGEADATVGGQAKAQLKLGENFSGSGTAFGGGKLKGGGDLSWSPKGVNAGAKVEAFAGGSLGVEANVGGETVGAKAGVEGMAGLGLKGEVKAQFGADKVGVSVNLGAAFGLGASATFGFSFSPRGIASEVQDAVTGLRDGVAGTMRAFRDAVK
jgi:outer membrane protein OmpA-like peptidoglycan-associated protein